MSASGLPIGVQLVAATGREDLLIQVASQLERARAVGGPPPARPRVIAPEAGQPFRRFRAFRYAPTASANSDTL